ncbi:MAG: bifunctional (p)ppGpp synthetase/guanosine-3',5'-bis(diphosphate) 3'-pyrophosphohydrolase [Gammaproteobacteria bacterium]|nr:bifunctional (p)ppGpp synthetase/guanosine-3',5'-bis(diphosphate) 3'-pyrophosphohydrolase [Gammaproteobacteria bacterium]
MSATEDQPIPAPLNTAAALAEQCVRPGNDADAAILARATAIVSIVEELGGDPTLRAAAMLYPFIESGLLSKRQLQRKLPDDVARLARELVRLGGFTFPENWDVSAGLDEQQGETLRKMLLSIVEDVRLVLVLLANQLHRLRQAKSASDEQRRRIALETSEIYAPLANKLGVWQLKWEMEDLSFRFLEPDTYKKIAKLLAEKRVSREAYISTVLGELEAEVSKLGIKADIQGRPKHIYSIYKKMQRKGVGFEHIFDVRAVRVLVESVADCYAVLGAVHGRWPYIPGEFDDYIATPKGNFYRSLHTAVIGPGNKTLEIQIRTHEMHAHAELGVAAHWKYKEGGGSDAAFERKIRWVRSLLDPTEADSDDDFIERFRADLFEDRVYVLTPQGDILDLPYGSTPLDFAYHVHTELGHRCRGARVDGRIVPLTHKLTNGVQVEVITAKSGEPSRDWLIPQLGYLASTRARSKVRTWFRRQDQQQNRDQGQHLLERELSRLGLGNLDHGELSQEFSLSGPTDLYIAVGAGDITVADIAKRLQQRLTPDEEEVEGRELPVRKPTTGGPASIDVEGVGGLMTTFARCCKPVPPDAIAGYITLGRGVTIHRQHCANFLRLADRYRERVLEVSWAGEERAAYPVDIAVEAYDRRNLVKDISSLLSAEKINIVGMTTTTNKQDMTATFSLTVEIHSLEELSKLMLRIGNLPNIISVTRRS